jgi:hypothetical protein
MSIILPEAVVERTARDCAERVRDIVNSHEGRERLSVERITVVQQQACMVWADVEACDGDELKGIWEAGIDAEKVAEMVIAGPDVVRDDLVDE